MVNRPEPTQRTNRQAKRKGQGERLEPVPWRAVKPDRRFPIRMPLTTLAGLIGFNPAVTKHLHGITDPAIQRTIGVEFTTIRRGPTKANLSRVPVSDPRIERRIEVGTGRSPRNVTGQSDTLPSHSALTADAPDTYNVRSNYIRNVHTASPRLPAATQPRPLRSRCSVSQRRRPTGQPLAIPFVGCPGVAAYVAVGACGILAFGPAAARVLGVRLPRCGDLPPLVLPR